MEITHKRLIQLKNKLLYEAEKKNILFIKNDSTGLEEISKIENYFRLYARYRAGIDIERLNDADKTELNHTASEFALEIVKMYENNFKKK